MTTTTYRNRLISNMLWRVDAELSLIECSSDGQDWQLSLLDMKHAACLLRRGDWEEVPE